MADGTLHISFKSSSMFLTDHLPVEIRDARNRLVLRSAGSVQKQLPEGLYIVEATLPGGGRHSEVVAVSAEAPTELLLDRKKPGKSGDDDDGETGTPGTLTQAGVVLAELLEVQACTLRTIDSSGWIFDPVPGPHGTPVATFAITGTRVSTSLLVNPQGMGEDRSCVVTVVRRGERKRLDVSFARQRRVAWTLEGMVRSDDVVSAVELFRNAEGLLLGKYQDPPAAALGGLTLHRIGHLPERQGWVENLARDFGWVADGRVLLAALLSKDEDPIERARGLDTLLEVAPARPLFTDGLALLMQLLRSWPDGSGPKERQAALESITSNPQTVDWDAMTLTTYDED